LSVCSQHTFQKTRGFSTTLNIIYRSCDRVQAFSGTKPRPFGTKAEVILRCFESLLKSIQHYDRPCELVIIDDHSSQDTVDKMKALLERYDIESIFLIMDETTGNGESLKYCYNYAKDNLDGLLFFCEDDYLFVETMLDECEDMFRRGVATTGVDVCIHPVDYIDRYKKMYACMVLLGKNRHFRTIQHTTGTFFITKAILEDQWENYMKFTQYGIEPGLTEDHSINLVYKKYPCLSPLPTLGHHLQYEETLSPYLEY